MESWAIIAVVVQRLNALEAIVTDGKFELNRQIEGL